MAWSIRNPQAKRTDQRSEQAATYRKLYKSARWKMLRELVLADSPLCRECETSGAIEAADEVDHIKPHRGNAELFFDAGNLQGLCKRCHARKTARGE